MEISSPLCITSRLLPGCRIGGAELSIKYCYGINARDDRQYYHWRIDIYNSPSLGLLREFKGDKLCSGVGGGTLQEGLESLLGFLSAFGEACEYQNQTGEQEVENAHLFPVGLAEWAIQNRDAITMMEVELQEHPDKLIVE